MRLSWLPSAWDLVGVCAHRCFPQIDYDMIIIYLYLIFNSIFLIADTADLLLSCGFAAGAAAVRAAAGAAGVPQRQNGCGVAQLEGSCGRSVGGSAYIARRGFGVARQVPGLYDSDSGGGEGEAGGAESGC